MTSIPELISKIKNLDLFITGDSWSNAYCSSFSKFQQFQFLVQQESQETSQWLNE